MGTWVHYRYMCEWDNQLLTSRTVTFIGFFMYAFFIPTLATNWVIIKIKSSADILQGISKLDYLLKVSELQRYKVANQEDSKREYIILVNETEGASLPNSHPFKSLTSSKLNNESLFMNIRNGDSSSKYSFISNQIYSPSTLKSTNYSVNN